MPPFLYTLITRNATSIASSAHSPGLQVICAFPVSGQYGPGSRVLYYVLVAACVFARKAEWLRKACLAAALLFPAVAALHAIVLAAIHIPGAVDMDVYGAFQLCAIGILAAPVTARQSQTYFWASGRNIIFLWAILILAGLLALTVEFYRLNSFPCTQDNNGNPIPLSIGAFPYNNVNCSVICNTNQGPFSPLRGGSANNINITPSPTKLTFNTAMLLSAACCIPAILMMVSMWIKILETNSRFGPGNNDNPISGTNGATTRQMNTINDSIKKWLTVIEVPVFAAAVLAILIIGERNLFSSQVRYDTEPMANIGQWAPIVGTGLAIFGSLYVLLAERIETILYPPVEGEKGPSTPSSQVIESSRDASPGAPIARAPTIPPLVAHGGRSSSNSRRELTIMTISPERDHDHHRARRTLTSSTTATFEPGSRKKVAKTLNRVSEWFGTAADDQFDDSEFRRGRAIAYPEVPGEEQRNSKLRETRKIYNANNDREGNIIPHARSRSRASSFRSSGSGIDREASPPGSPTSPHRRDTLEVPTRVDSRPLTPRNSSPGPSTYPPGTQPPPSIIVSDDTETFAAQTPERSATAPSSPSEPKRPSRTATLPPSR